MALETGERRSFVVGNYARDIAPSYGDLLGIQAQPDIAVDSAIGVKHTLRTGSKHHGGSGSYYLLERRATAASTPPIAPPQSGGLAHKIVEFALRPFARSRATVSAVVLLDRTSS